MLHKEDKNSLRSWIICIIAAFFFFYLVFQLAIFNTIGSALMQDLGIKASKLSLLSSMYLYMCSLTFLPAGLLLDRFSTKALMIAASIVCIVGTILLSVTSLVWVAFLGRILVGMSNPFSLLGPLRLVSRWFTPQKIGLLTGLVVTIGMSGGIVAQSPFTLLIHLLGGWRSAMLINVAFGVLLTLLMVLFIKDEPKQIPKVNKTNKPNNLLHSLKHVCFKKQNWLCGAYTGLIGTPVTALGALWGNFYLMQSKGYSPIEAGNLSSLIFIGLIFGPLSFGWISDKMGRRKPPILFGALGTLLCALIIIYINVPTAVLSALLFLLGYFSGSQSLNYPLVAESNSSDTESTSVAFISIIVNIIGASSQIILGWLIALYWNGAVVNGVPFYSVENFKFGLSLLPIGFFVCIVLSLFMKESFNKRMSMPT